MSKSKRQAEIEALETAFWQSMVDGDPSVATGMLTEPALMVSGHGANKFDHAGYTKMATDETFRLKKSFEAAERAGATYIVIVGENEVKANEFAVKNIKTGIQQTVKHEVLAEFFSPAIERRNGR